MDISKTIFFMEKPLQNLDQIVKGFVYPIPRNELEEKFQSCVAVEYDPVVEKNKSKFSQHHLQYVSHRKSCLLNKAKTLNIRKIEEIMYENITEYLKYVDYESYKNIDQANLKIQEIFDGKDDILLYLAMSRNLKPDVNFDENVLASNLSQIYTITRYYSDMFVLKYDDSYQSHIKSYSKKLKLINIIFEGASKIYSKQVNSIKSKIEALRNKYQKEFEDKINKETSIDVCSKYVRKAKKEFLNELKTLFVVENNEIFSLESLELLTLHYRSKIGETFKETDLSKSKNLKDNIDILDDIISKYCSDILKPFSNQELKEFSKPLFLIILTTNYLESNPDRHEKYFLILSTFYDSYCSQLEKNHPEFGDIHSSLMDKEQYDLSRPKLNKILKEESKLFCEASNQDVIFHAMSSIFIIFAQDIVQHLGQSYDADIHYMLKSIFRNLAWGKLKFSNYEYLKHIEYIYSNYKQESIQEQKKPDVKTLNMIRNTVNVLFKEHHKFEDQLALISNEISPKISRPSKFFLENVFSGLGKRSKSITIVVPGYTSEDYHKKDLYYEMINFHSHSEFFVLNWKSFREKDALNMIGQTFKNIGEAIAGSIKNLFSKKVDDKQKKHSIFKNLWDDTYEEAIKSGVFLAHLLADTKLFHDKSISLAGFSLGTVVIMNCIFELERLGRKDIIYDVLIMGGVININQIERAHLDVIANNLINAYSYDDNILKYMLKCVDWSSVPAGLNPIMHSDKKVRNIDASKFVGGHTDYQQKMAAILSKVDFIEDIDFKLEIKDKYL